MSFSRIILRIMGWKISGSFPAQKKLVIVSVPHTSMWDYVLGRLSLFAFKVKPKILIKEEMFFFPLGWFLKRIGGIPVNRLEKTDIVEKLIREFNNSDSFYLVITPEGTRKKVTEWKTGFYRIARGANIPILVGYFDYKHKIIGLSDVFYLGDNVDVEINRIKELVNHVTPKHPVLYSYK